MKRRLALGGLAGLTTIALIGCSPDALRFKSIDMSGADYAKDFNLPDQNGQMRSLKEFRGKAVVVFFGFIQCPDVCPTTLNELAEVRRLLGADGQRVQGIFITVDPERDTPELLKAYLANFDPSFIALRGSPEQLAAVAKEFKVYYKKAEGKNAGSYSMDHTAASYVYDPQGRLRLYTRYGTGPQSLADDLRILLKQE